MHRHFYDEILTLVEVVVGETTVKLVRNNHGHVLTNTEFVKLLEKVGGGYNHVTDEIVRQLNDRMDQERRWEEQERRYEEELVRWTSLNPGISTGFRPKGPGSLYLAKHDRWVAWKIGVTINWACRRKQIGEPVTLVHVVSVADMGSAERALHMYFSDRRLHGEWFSLVGDRTADCIEKMNLAYMGDLSWCPRLPEKEKARKAS